MQKPSKRQRKGMERATARYQASLGTVGVSYLADRGLTDLALIQGARLGRVDSPEPGHEIFCNRLTIPYMDMMGVCGMKFRCLQPHHCKSEGCSKYLALTGVELTIYNITDADSVKETIHVTEGELDCLILKQVFPDDPVVGVPGADLWKRHHPYHFAGFERVLLWMDGDQAGKGLGNKIRKDVRNAEVVQIPQGMDVTDVYLQQGAEGLRALADLEEEDA